MHEVQNWADEVTKDWVSVGFFARQRKAIDLSLSFKDSKAGLS